MLSRFDLFVGVRSMRLRRNDPVFQTLVIFESLIMREEGTRCSTRRGLAK